MPLRPPGLPDFKLPPVTEVVLGVQFNSVQGFLTPHLGLIWDSFKKEFPYLEEKQALPPTFETFGRGPQLQSYIEDLFTTPQMPRVFFINDDRTQLLQIQRDRFVHNWRKVGDANSYPRFEKMVVTFEEGFQKLERVFENLKLGPIVPNQCEVSYVNQIEIPDGETVFTILRALFGNFWSQLSVEGLGDPADAKISFRYVMKKDDVPIGRVTVQAQPARRADRASILQLTLTARGAPQPENMTGVLEFLALGRERIVTAFSKLTTAEMHQTWERTQ